MNLKVVKKNKILQWPSNLVGHQGNKVRGRGGYVVDLDAPMEDAWCGGYLRVFMRDTPPDVTEATPIDLKAARQAIKAWEKRHGKYEPKAGDGHDPEEQPAAQPEGATEAAEATEGEEDETPVASTSEIPDPDDEDEQ